jgi:hypothetical protein
VKALQRTWPTERKEVRVRYEGLGAELGQFMLTTDQLKSSADMRALLFQRIASTVAVQFKTRREQPVMHFLDGQPLARARAASRLSWENWQTTPPTSNRTVRCRSRERPISHLRVR